jgi:uncharacterized protein (TIGR02246 family)
MHHLLRFLCAIAISFSGNCLAQDAAPEGPAHDELRALRKEVVAAIVAGDVEAQLKHVHPNVVVTWHNHVVCRGHDGLRKFMEKSGSTAFKGYKVEPEADELTILHGGDTGISFGRSVGTFQLGKEFEWENRWTATLVKEDGRWLVAAYQVSINAVDNPILNSATSMLGWVGGGAGGIGLLLGC